MIDEVYDRLTSVFERRFLKNAFLPVLLFFPSTPLPVLLQGDRINRLVNAWEHQQTSAKLLLISGYFALCWMCAAIVASQWRNVIRLYEGYPLRRWPWLLRLGTRYHEAQVEELEEHDTVPDSQLLAWAFPERNDLLPTRLGNVLRAGEAEPQYRFKADPIVLWPLLYHVLPRETINDIADARATLEFLLVFSLWCCGFAVANPLLAVAADSSVSVSMFAFAFGLTLAYWAYLAAIPAAREYATYLWSTFELYRFHLLQRLKIQAPGNLEEEMAIWDDLREFVLKGGILERKYDPGVSEQVVRIGGIQSPHGRG